VLFSDWTPRKLSVHEENVEVYSNCDEVELFLNGVSLGKQSRSSDDSPRVWKVQFAPGALTAVAKNWESVGGFRGGRVPGATGDTKGLLKVATYELRTAGPPAKITLTADRNSLGPTWDDVVFVTATVVDANGVFVPTASDLIKFNVTGPGVIAAVDSGNNASHEPFQASERKAYQGSCFAMIKALGPTGRITLAASATGLQGSSVTIVVRK
jgi:beta-galactosidase